MSKRQIKLIEQNLNKIKKLNETENLPKIFDDLGIPYHGARSILEKKFNYFPKIHAYNKGVRKLEKIYTDKIDYIQQQLQLGESLLEISKILKLEDHYNTLYSYVKRDFPDLLTRKKSNLLCQRMVETKNSWKKELTPIIIELYKEKKILL